MSLWFLWLLVVLKGQILAPTELAPYPDPQPIKIALLQQPSKPTASRSIDSIFLRLPSYQELVGIINGADFLALSKLLQVIEGKIDEIDCQALTIYSDEVIGMVKVAIEKKTLTAQKIKIVIETAKAEVERLARQIKRLDKERKQLDLSTLQQDMEELIIRLEKAYDNYNEMDEKLQPQRAKIVGFEKHIQNLTAQADQERNSIVTNNLLLTDLNTEIIQLRKQLQLKQNQKQAVENNIRRSEKNLRQLESDIQIARGRIKTIENSGLGIQDRADELKKVYTDLEVDVERLRNDLTKGLAKEDSILLEIEMMEEKIFFEEGKIVQREYQQLKTNIRTLNRALPRFEEQSNQLYYNCYGQGSVESIDIENVVVYIVKAARLPIFLAENYGSVTLQSLASKTDVAFKLVDVFGGSWREAYGHPFGDGILLNKDLFIEGDFTCLNPSLVESGQGTIKSIKNNEITIENDTTEFVLVIGACSRIQSHQYVPKPGNTIFYKGIFITNTLINLYVASCF